MMDFLRRLAPARETDTTRAIAVLPSRFASESPLRGTTVEARPAQLSDEDVSPSVQAASASVATNVPAAQHDSAARVPAYHAAPRPYRSERTHAPADAPDVEWVDPATVQHPHDASSARAIPTKPELLGAPAIRPSAQHNGRRIVSLPDQARSASPLSESILTQRTLQSRDDSEVVHVTIGRIDVVASTAPAPAVRRNPTPRQPTVTLADYLRGGSGSRR